jgi:aminopeptidase N
MRVKKLITIKVFFIISALLSIQLQAQNYGCQAGKNTQMPPGLYYCAENLRSDTFDILKYTINLEIGNSVNKLIQGNTAIRFAPKLNNRSFIRLDLLKLIIDSVKENTTTLLYSYNDTILKINFAATKNIVDTSTITVYYKGQPQGDPAGWGGFYFDNTGGAQYAYNLGVGFGAKPHNYGRVWFPCFDNFVEHSKYEFNITSDSTRRAFCNGLLISDIVTGTKRTRQWVMNEQIPTYLASVALANYRQVNWTTPTLSGVKPITLVGVASDTSAMKAGFVNLKNCITGFENFYGPYKWNRFGYCLVPFNSGAMEHATNIAYPKAVIGTLTYEAQIMAHELSHHWWGDLITCETQEDMWINEGMATYSQYLFTEWQYSKPQSMALIKNEHENLLHFLHKKEGGFRAISGLPHSLTYGDHVYKKGADVAHTLRGYMGDVGFFNALKYALTQNQFKNVNSTQLRDLFQTGSGQSLTDFFNNWVLSGGWPHFAIDSVKYVQLNANSYNAIVSIKQKLYGAPSLYNNVPLELCFFKSDWSRVTQNIIMSGATGNFTVNIPYNAVYCALNYDSKISDATSFENKTIKNIGNLNWNLGKMSMTVLNKGVDSSLIRVVHNYVKPDPFKSNPLNHKLSDQHFWRVEGILSPGFVSKATFSFDGNKVNVGANAYLDTLLTLVNADSIRLFYRPNASGDWKLLKNTFIYQTNTKAGFIQIDTLKLGEYAFGNSTDTANVISVKENFKSKLSLKLFPNPAKNNLKIEFAKSPEKPLLMSLMSVDGKLALTQVILERLTSVDLKELAKGTYVVKLELHNQTVYCEKLIIE